MTEIQGKLIVVKVGARFKLARDQVITTASCCIEDMCLGYPGDSTVTSRPLDSITFPWLAIPATQPRASTQSSGTHHTKLTVEMGRGRGGCKKMLINRLQ